MAIQEQHAPPLSDARTDSAKRRQIMQGAGDVFLAQGFDAASMGAIARQAGVSKGTLYVYFKSKEELFESIVEEQCAQQAEGIFTLDREQDIEATLTRMADAFVRFICRPGAVSAMRTVIAIADRMPELGARFYQTGPARGIASLTAYLEEQVAAGVLRSHDCEVAAAQFIDSCLSMTYKPMLFNAAGAPDDDRIARVIAMAVGTYLAAYRKV